MYANPCYCALLTIHICSTCDGEVVEANEAFAVTNFELYCITLSVSFACLLYMAVGWAGSLYAIPGYIAIVPLLIAAYKTYNVGFPVEPKNFGKFVQAKNIHAFAGVLSLIGCVAQGVVAGITGQLVFEYIDRDLAGGTASVAADVKNALPGTDLILDLGLNPFIFFAFTMLGSGVMFVCMVQSIRSVCIMTSAASEARGLGYDIPDKYACSCCLSEEDFEDYDQGRGQTKVQHQGYSGPQNMTRYDL